LLGRIAIATATGGFALAVAGPAQAAGTVPNGSLKSVSCPSATECIAVGSGFGGDPGTQLALAERWNGTNWIVQPTHNPRNAVSSSLSGVSCPTASVCLAVGSLTTSTGRTFVLAERWNGKSWAVQAIPNPRERTDPSLSAVSCASAKACMAVGRYTNSSGQTVPLAERWNGTSWALQSPSAPIGASLFGVSCTSANACTAVGYGQPSGVAERWNGTTWVLQSTPGLGDMAAGGFDSVSCPSLTACTATGSVDLGGGVPVQLAERWNSRIWGVQATPNPGAFVDLAGVSCPSRTDCSAVGFDFNFNTSTQESFAMQWNGTSWTLQATPSPPGASDTLLFGVSCTSANACTAVGTYTSDGRSRTLAQRWDGISWRTQPTP
jgi:hypothetical protein